jgi:hypothetical protein
MLPIYVTIEDFCMYVRSDGLWDVISTKRAVQLVVEVKDLDDRFVRHCSLPLQLACSGLHCRPLTSPPQSAGKGEEELWRRHLSGGQSSQPCAGRSSESANQGQHIRNIRRF